MDWKGRIYTGDGSRILVWTASGEVIAVIEGFSGVPHDIEITPSGDLYFTVSTNQVHHYRINDAPR